ncbi:MAG: cell shape determination protein CcmA [Alkaliphilus sp.]|nr:MAG: cell shape determination protein CcmA [Alkaliphilus sp.]
MFNKKRATSFSQIDSLIGKNCVFEGVVNSKGTLRIDGEIKGEVISEGNVFLSADGKITGNIKASNILISGEVMGDIIATDSLRITSSGRLLGDSNAKTFVLDENAVFEGKSKQYIESSTKDTDKQKSNTKSTDKPIKKQEKK